VNKFVTAIFCGLGFLGGWLVTIYGKFPLGVDVQILPFWVENQHCLVVVDEKVLDFFLDVFSERQVRLIVLEIYVAVY
jgi:hypothetical protein